MTTKTLYPFLAITFGLTWGVASLLILFPEQIIAIFGEIGISNPLYILAVYSPAIAGIFLVWQKYRLEGLGRFFRRFTLSSTLWWWLFIILGIPSIMYIGAALTGTISDPFPFYPWHQVFPALLLALLLGPIEELGWRGLALPLLQQKYAPFWAGLIIGIIWAVWHLPAFLISGTPHSAWAFAPFFGGVIAMSIIMTAIFNDSRGSLLMPFLMHFQANNPIWPDAQPWDNILLIISVIIIVWIKRHKMFKRGAGVTDILMPV